jgi:hypothetical protein
MAAISEQRLFDALTTLSRAFADGNVPQMPGTDASAEPSEADESPAIAAMDDEARQALGEAALAVAFGAFASRGGDSGPIHTLVAAMGLMGILAGDEPDPPAEILGAAAEDADVEAEIERAGEAVDAAFGRDATAEAVTAILEARILGTSITLAGCTLPENVDGQKEVRLRAARCLTKLAAGLLVMNAAEAGAAGLPADQAPIAPNPGPNDSDGAGAGTIGTGT